MSTGKISLEELNNIFTTPRYDHPGRVGRFTKDVNYNSLSSPSTVWDGRRWKKVTPSRFVHIQHNNSKPIRVYK